jgi:hypothetical protein
MAEAVPGPSGSGSVVLELGPGVGALVLHAPPGLDGREIEISSPGGPGGSRTHSRVRLRRTAAGSQYAAVYPDLPAGEYTVWRDAVTPAMSVTIAGGQVSTASWPEP